MKDWKDILYEEVKNDVQTGIFATEDYEESK